jgi:hypothetical protein
VRAEFQTEGSKENASKYIAADGIVGGTAYFGSTDGYLYAVN